MREAFRNKVPRGPIKCKYWIDRSLNQFEYWHTDAELLTDQITTVVDYYNSIGIKLTNRQLYYQLVGKDYIPNAMEVYKRVCVFITDLRYCGIIDWDSIEDKSRVPKRWPQWNNIVSFINSVAWQYRLPRWDGQEYYLEMYCEKEAGVNVLQPIADKYHIHFGFNKGYSSAAAMYNLAKRVAKQIDEHGKRVVILYFGDHDPSGLDMIRDIRERITEFLEQGYYYTVPDFEIVPVSLTMAQIKKYKPPPNPAKIKDPRAKWYIRKYGPVSWELDAIDALELRNMAEEHILRYLDLEPYEKIKEIEQEQIEPLIKLAEKLTE